MIEFGMLLMPIEVSITQKTDNYERFQLRILLILGI